MLVRNHAYNTQAWRSLGGTRAGNVRVRVYRTWRTGCSACLDSFVLATVKGLGCPPIQAWGQRRVVLLKINYIEAFQTIYGPGTPP